MKRFLLFSVACMILFSFVGYNNPEKENHCGLFLAKSDGKYGYIDKTGTYVINPQFEDATHFSEGLAAVKIRSGSTGKWGYIDKAGKIVINPQFDDAKDFSEGLAAVRIGDNYGYIDKTGTYVINPQFDDAEDFSEGLETKLTF